MEEDGKERFKYKDITIDIYKDIFSYKGKRVDVSGHASREMSFLKLDIINIIHILETGFDCQRSKRKEGILEKCVIKGNKVIKVVAAEKFSNVMQEETFIIIHVGKFSLKKRK